MSAATINVHIDTLPYRPPLGPMHHAKRDTTGSGRFVKAKRPSDGQPSGAPFDFEEYEARKADRRARHEVELEKRHAAIKRKRQEERDSAWEAWHIDGANLELAGELSCDPKERHRRIWQALKAAEQSYFLNHVLLPQRDRIFNARQKRVRGVGAAARRAGFSPRGEPIRKVTAKAAPNPYVQIEDPENLYYLCAKCHAEELKEAG